jgi:hypothetical protein
MKREFRVQSSEFSEANVGGCSGVRSPQGEPRAIAKRGGAGRRGRLRPHAPKALILISMMLLASCGFQPLEGQAYRQQLNVDLSSLAVAVEGTGVTIQSTTTTNTNTIVPRRYTELLRAEILDQFNPRTERAEPLFLLKITYGEQQNPRFVNPDGTASRGDIVYDSTYTVTRLSDAKPVASGRLQRISTFNSSPTADYASYVSIEDARKRGLIELAQDYKLRMATLLPTLNNPNAQAVVAPAPTAPALQPVPSYETLRQRY